MRSPLFATGDAVVVCGLGADVRLLCTGIGVLISTVCHGPDDSSVALPFELQKGYGRSLFG